MYFPRVFVLLVFLISPCAFAMGPAPFSDGSPLPSGNDGTYQASARGNNLGGVIRFAISSGSQLFGTDPLTADSTQRSLNSWAIFFEGKLYTGLTDAVISGSEISGVLSAPASMPRAINNLQLDGGIPITEPVGLEIANGQLPTDALIRGQNLSGYFEANLNQKSPNGNFQGSGEIAVTLPPFYAYNMQQPTVPGAPAPGNNFTPTNPTTGQSQAMTQSASQGIPDPSNEPATSLGHLTPLSETARRTFRIRGTRTSTTVAASTQGSSAQ